MERVFVSLRLIYMMEDELHTNHWICWRVDRRRKGNSDIHINLRRLFVLPIPFLLIGIPKINILKRKC
jgi:hypothetical protein